MAKNMRKPLAAKKVLLHITDVVADTTADVFTTNPFINFWNYWYGDRVGAYVDLGFVSGDLTDTDLAFDADTFNYRIDHVATDFTLTFPSMSTEKKSYLGSKDDVGTPNSYLDETDPDKAVIKVTVSGKPTDLDSLIASSVTNTLTNYSRYNFGQRPSTRYGFAIGIIDTPSTPEAATSVTQLYFLNNCIITDGGEIKASSDGNYERTLSIECDATDLWSDIADGQNTVAVINI